MMCFKDMTFCNSDCINTKCMRNFSPKLREEAVKWWGDETFPIAYSASFKEGCDIYQSIQGDSNAVA